MARLRLNQELRSKIGTRMRVHIEQEDTQEKEKFFQLRENFKASKIKLGNLPKYVCQDNIQKKILKWHIIFKTSMTT